MAQPSWRRGSTELFQNNSQPSGCPPSRAAMSEELKLTAFCHREDGIKGKDYAWLDETQFVPSYIDNIPWFPGSGPRCPARATAEMGSEHPSIYSGLTASAPSVMRHPMLRQPEYHTLGKADARSASKQAPTLKPARCCKKGVPAGSPPKRVRGWSRPDAPRLRRASLVRCSVGRDRGAVLPAERQNVPSVGRIAFSAARCWLSSREAALSPG